MDSERAPQHRHRGLRAVQRLVEHAPSSGGLALWMHHRDVPDDDDEKRTVWTDGKSIFYPPAFDALPLPLQTGWVAHQVLHVALRHVARYGELRRTLGDVDLELFNRCADAIVNSALGHLRWLELPRGALTLEALLRQALQQDTTAEQALLQWDVERLYRAVDDRKQGRNGKQQDGPKAAAVRQAGRGEQRDLQPAPDDDTSPEQEAEATREWAERLARAHAGDGAHSILRTLLGDLPRVHTPWEQVLRTQLARALAKQPGPSWSRPARSWIANQGRIGGRRMPWEPGTGPDRRVPRLALVVDVSGSIDGGLVERFTREIDAITRRLEAPFTLIVGDERVLRVQACAPGRGAWDGLAREGGGGTDFAPMIEEAERHRPDLTVVLTDLEGPADCRPRAPVLWAVPEAFAAAVPPFGRKLVLR